MNQPAPPATDRSAGGEVVVLTGPPGAGKTTVAGLPAGRFALGVHLRCDDFRHFIRRGAIAPHLPEAHGQNEVVTGVLARAASGYAAGGYRVVLRRATARGAGALTDPGPVRSVYEQFTGLGEFERHVVGSTALDPGGTADAVLDGVTDGTFLTHG